MPPEHETRAPAAPARSPSASTSTSTSTSSSGTSTASAGNAATAADAGLGAPVSEGGLPGLHTETDAGHADEAWSIFTTLAPNDLATLKADTAFVPRFLHLVGPDRSATALWTLQYTLRLYLELANLHCASNTGALAHVLRDVGIHGTSDVAAHTADLTGLTAFLARPVMDPVIAVSSATEDATLLGTTGAHPLLLTTYTGSPLSFLRYLPSDSALVLDLFVTNQAARDWLMEDAPTLVDHILNIWVTPGPWYRTVGRALLVDLDALLSADPGAWSAAFATVFAAADPEDTALLAPPSDLFRLVIGCMASRDAVQAAHACASLGLSRVECIKAFANERWLTIESARVLLQGATLAQEIEVASSPDCAVALNAFAWIGDLLPLLVAQPAVLAGLYMTHAELRGWVNYDPARFEALATPMAAMWVAPLVLSQEVSILLSFAAHHPTEWRTAVAEPFYVRILGQLPKPCAEADVPGVWALWKDANRGVDASLETYHTLYGLRIWTSGAQPERMLPDWTNPANGITFERKQIIATVNPAQATINDYLAHLQTLPRGQVATSAVGFGQGWNVHYKRKTPPADASWDLSGGPLFEDGGTSQYWTDMNFILMYTDSAGGFTGGQSWMNGPQRISDDGNSSGVGGPRQTHNADGTTTPGAPTTDAALTYFQNHARHEIGHGVGARTYQGMSIKGDAASKKWANWKDSSDTEMRNSYFAGQSGNVTDVPDNANVNQTVAASEIGLYLTHIARTGAEPVASAAAGTGGQMTGLFVGSMDDRISAISVSSVGSTALAQYVVAINGSNHQGAVHEGAYEYPGFTPPGTTAYIYSKAEGGFRKYDTAVMTELTPVLGWYSLASASEMFAEIYTQHYSTAAQWVPSTRSTVDWSTFFTQLEASPQLQLQAGVTPAIPGVGGAPAPAAPAPAPAPGGGAPTPGPSGAPAAGGLTDTPEARAGARGTPI